MTKKTSSSNSTTKTTVVDDYFSMTRDDMPSWMYPALNREAWDEFSGKLEGGLGKYARYHEFIRALTWFYGVDIDSEGYIKPDIHIEMMPYTDGHAKAPMAIIHLTISNDTEDWDVALEMTWVDYYFVMARANSLIAEDTIHIRDHVEQVLEDTRDDTRDVDFNY